MGALLLAATLALALIPSVQAADAALAVTGPDQPVKAGETFSAAVTLTGSAPFSAVQFTLFFDREAMTCRQIAPGAALEGAIADGNPEFPAGAIFAAASAESLAGEGEIARFTFLAKRDLDRPALDLGQLVLANSEGEDLTGGLTVTGAGVTRFSDVAGHWAQEDIRRAAVLGLMQGDAEGAFRPNDGVDRAQLVTVLWRMAGRPEPAGEAPFSDLEGLDQEARQAIAWARERGIVNGTSDRTFDPRGALTRQAAMKILFAYAGGKSGMEQLFFGVYDGAFSDSGRIAGWAREAVYWGVYHELIAGTGEHRLSPETAITRAQLARILIRYVDNIKIET